MIQLDLGWNIETLLLALFLLSSWCIFIIFKYSIPKYLEKKGENLANKQDIENLTSLVKKVEHTFIEKTEVLKSKLGVASQLNLMLNNEERAALMHLHTSFYEYYDFITDLSLNGTNLEVPEEINKCEVEHQVLYKKLFRSKVAVMLFVDDELTHIEEFITDLALLLNDATSKFYFFIHEVKALNLDYLPLDSNQKVDEYYNRIKEIQDKRIVHIKENIETLGPKLRELTSIIKKYLRERTVADIEDNK